MATYSALHVRTTDVGAVVAELRGWLERAHGVPVALDADHPWPGVYGRAFASSTDRPTLFAVGTHGADWVVAHFNCFSDLAPLAASLSRSLAARTVVVNAQSVSDAYLVAVYEDGLARRTLEFGDGLTRNEGAPFGFEGEIFGIDDDELPPDDEVTLGRDEVERFCAALGLRIWDHPDATDGQDRWSVVRVWSAPRRGLLKHLLAALR